MPRNQPSTSILLSRIPFARAGRSIEASLGSLIEVYGATGVYKTSAFIIVRVNGLSEEKEKKTAFIVERFVWMFGCTPDERSDENLKWMREKGYNVKK